MSGLFSRNIHSLELPQETNCVWATASEQEIRSKKKELELMEWFGLYAAFRGLMPQMREPRRRTRGSRVNI
jgi:hypothetical protein